MFETSIADLDLAGKRYDEVLNLLSYHELSVLYECCMSSLTDFQKGLYEKVIAKVPKEIALFSDPIAVSFALRDACDLSGVEYVWLDLEGDDDVGYSAWVREEDWDAVVRLAIDLLKRHLEKYLLDVYDRGTRNGIAGVWEAELPLQLCPVCGGASPERRVISANKRKFRGWTCTGCGHHVIVPSDALDYLKRGVEG